MMRPSLLAAFLVLGLGACEQEIAVDQDQTALQVTEEGRVACTLVADTARYEGPCEVAGTGRGNFLVAPAGADAFFGDVAAIRIETGEAGDAVMIARYTDGREAAWGMASQDGPCWSAPDTTLCLAEAG